MEEIINKQIKFQEVVGSPIHDKTQTNVLAEIYLFKAIEEIVELRKEFPSGLNSKSKTMKEPDEQRLYEELSDVVLFLINFMIVRGLKIEKLKETINSVQDNNFKHVESLN